MKLATYKDGSRDGQLVVVSRDLSSAHYASGIATRLQQVLDDWNFLSPQLEDLSTTLNHGKARHAFAFDPAMCMAPLPRAHQRVEAAAYQPHLARLSQLSGQALPEGLGGEPQLQQAASDDLLGPCDDLVTPWVGEGLDFGVGLAAITGDVDAGASPAQALESVRLLMLACDWSLRERAPGGAPLQARVACSFGPVAVTPDELGPAWQGGRAQLTLQTRWSGRKLGLLDAGAEMQFHFGQLIAQAARTRRLRAGCIVGNGPVAQADPAHGAASLADKRAMELAEALVAHTPWAQWGDTLRAEAKGRDGQSLFGAIEQTVSDPA